MMLIIATLSLGYGVGQVLSAFVTRVGGVTSPSWAPRDRYTMTQRCDRCEELGEVLSPNTRPLVWHKES